MALSASSDSRMSCEGADSPASSELTRELMGWLPTHPGLIEDLDKGHYFDSPAA